MDTYKGDSNGKKLARLKYWSSVQEALGPRFTLGRHLVLASREGGDISVLLGLGVPSTNIVAAELDRDAHAECSNRWPQVKVIRGDVREVARAHAKSFESVCLDFCAPQSESLMDLVRDTAILAMKPIGVLGVAFLAGRERDGGTNTFKERLQNRIRAADACRPGGEAELQISSILEENEEDLWELLWTFEDQELPTRFRLQLRDWYRKLGSPDRTTVETENPSKASRLRWLRDSLESMILPGEDFSISERVWSLQIELGKRLLPRRVMLMPKAWFSYRSASNESTGVPMVLGLFRFEKGAGNGIKRKLGRHLMLGRNRVDLQLDRNQYGSQYEFEMALMQEATRNGREYRFTDNYEKLPRSAEEAEYQLKQLIAANPSRPWDLLLNCPKGTIAAWRAHITRGTYGTLAASSE